MHKNASQIKHKSIINFYNVNYKLYVKYLNHVDKCHDI
jgi:predicted transcriptional regulator